MFVVELYLGSMYLSPDINLILVFDLSIDIYAAWRFPVSPAE